MDVGKVPGSGKDVLSVHNPCQGLGLKKRATTGCPFLKYLYKTTMLQQPQLPLALPIHMICYLPFYGM